MQENVINGTLVAKDCDVPFTITITAESSQFSLRPEFRTALLLGKVNYSLSHTERSGFLQQTGQNLQRQSASNDLWQLRAHSVQRGDRG